MASTIARKVLSSVVFPLPAGEPPLSAVEEEEHTASRWSRPVSNRTRIPAVTQLDAIRKALATGDVNQAREFCEALIAYPERNGLLSHQSYRNPTPFTAR